MTSKLIQILKTIVSDVRQASVPSILLWLVGGAGGLLSVYKVVADGLSQTINIQTPLWATILMALLACLYIHLHNKKLLKIIDGKIQSLPSSIPVIDNSKPPPIKTIYHNNLLWLSDDMSPFCPACYEINGKMIHTKRLHDSNNFEEWDYYECHNCNYRAEFSEHPHSVPF